MLWWYGRVLQKEDNHCVKKCMEYEVEGSTPRDRPKRTWREVVQKLDREDAMDCSRWRKLKGWLMIRLGMNGCMFFMVPAHLGSPRQRAVKWLLLLKKLVVSNVYDSASLDISHWLGSISWLSYWKQMGDGKSIPNSSLLEQVEEGNQGVPLTHI